MKIIFGLLVMMGFTVAAMGATSLFFALMEEIDEYIESLERRAERRKGKG